MIRNKTKKVRVGDIFVGGDSKITVQSMTNTDTRNKYDTIKQINNLERAGCDIVRCAVPDLEACEALSDIVDNIKIPLVADIHFNYKLALAAIDSGISALRINPGNIGNIEKVKIVAKSAKEKNIPIRIGVNSGSLEKDLLEKYGSVTPEALVESALRHVEILESVNFQDIVISIKASDVMKTIESYRLISKKVNYPLHLGVTEAGTTWRGTIKSSIGIGALLSEGIGDTLRVSLTGDPLEEVRVGNEILKSLGKRKDGIQFISCPTCGRTQINLVQIAEKVEEELKYCNKDLTVAIMGCVVNGPGEAKEADIGIAGGKNEGLLFKKGKIIKKVKEEDIIKELINEIEKM